MSEQTTTVEFRVWRQSGPKATGSWESHQVAVGARTSVLSALEKLNEAGAGIAHNVGGAEMGAGMLINGEPCRAGEVLVEGLSAPVFLEPFTSFAVVQDLQTDLGPLDADLAVVDEWAPEMLQDKEGISRYLRCGVYQEACPDYTLGGTYMGPAPIILMDWANYAPDGHVHREERLDMMMSERGIHHDRSSFSYEHSGPSDLSIRRSMARAKRDTSWRWLRNLLER